MALSIRLSRGGAKKRPYYRIVVADARSPRDGRFIERIGSYNPLLGKDDEKRVVLDTERAKHWLSVGAQPSDRVARFLDAAGVRERAARNNPKKAELGEKAKERLEEKAEKLKAAEEAKAEAEAAAAAAAAEAVEVVAEAVEEATETLAEEPLVVEALAETDPAPLPETPAEASEAAQEAVIEQQAEAATAAEEAAEAKAEDAAVEEAAATDNNAEG